MNPGRVNACMIKTFNRMKKRIGFLIYQFVLPAIQVGFLHLIIIIKKNLIEIYFCEKQYQLIHTHFVGFFILPCHWPGPERSASWYRQRRATWWSSMHKRYILICRTGLFYHYAFFTVP